MKRVNKVNALRYIVGIVGFVYLCSMWDAAGFLFGGLWFTGWSDGCELPLFRNRPK